MTVTAEVIRLVFAGMGFVGVKSPVRDCARTADRTLTQDADCD
jgi:hypothetical protein